MKYDEVNGGFKIQQDAEGSESPDSLLRKEEAELGRSLGVLAAQSERHYPADDNPYKGWSAEQLQAEVESLKGGAAKP